MNTVVRVRIGNDKVFMAKGVKELLQAIEQYESIKKATEATGISYPKAMRMLKTIEEQLGFSAVVSEKGGIHFGGTALTERGKQMLVAFCSIEKQVEDFAQKLVDKTFVF